MERKHQLAVIKTRRVLFNRVSKNPWRVFTDGFIRQGIGVVPRSGEAEREKEREEDQDPHRKIAP